MRILIIASGLGLALMNFTYAQGGMEHAKKTVIEKIAACNAKSTGAEQKRCIDGLQKDSEATVPSTPTIPATPTANSDTL